MDQTAAPFPDRGQQTKIYRAMEPDDDPDHRRAQRFRVFKAGTIEFGGNAIPCTVRNLSASGAALEVNSPLWFPDRFTLAIASDRSLRPCHVVWRRERRIGVAFEAAPACAPQ